ncbi:MAG: TlyA family RNA methyltransferase [Acidobacteriota bacterium]|nr:TlyA family RNA methyltransferase [Acidobacteriota bacterium]MDH3783870.1 TlyA family RNA methyltransferase [Acidobacteriota bacterium]
MATKPPQKRRLDEILVERGLAKNRSRAHALILAGRVLSGSTRLSKPGVRHAADVELTVHQGRRWVGRGAEKLMGALENFGIDATGRVAVDVGSSTGGFTQVLLEAGAKPVMAIDVGRGQMDWSLRNDPRVIVMEGINARHLEPGQLPETPSIAVMDVSFISIERILPALAGCLTEDGEIVSLIKPQFEVGRGQVGKGGIVRDASLHQAVTERIVQFVRAAGWSVRGLCRSPIAGTDGNREFFIHIGLGSATGSLAESTIASVIEGLCNLDGDDS